ncbi:MAG: BlaI/MecI/CopY family transcriptional regulator [Deltaproteobacteria bacterium]|nr:BlaI/MecI/CopY family transcriptional regulator [Deltaproteobacteria bacterium]
MKSLPRISEAEWRVMKVLWGRSPLPASEVIEALAKDTDWKPKTVKTLLNRLVAKRALGFEQDGRAYRYFPLVAEKDCMQTESRSFVERLYGGAFFPMLASFLERETLSDEQIAELKRILRSKGSKR